MKWSRCSALVLLFYIVGGAELGCGSNLVAPLTDASSQQDGGDSSTSDSSTTPDGAITDPSDGPPTYTTACTPQSKQTGAIINTQHGRFDGTLAYVVPKAGPSSCNGDDQHVHLQIRASNAIYDVAVDVGAFSGDVLLYETDIPLPAGAWSEGWHNDPLSYPQLGVHSAQFTPQDPVALAAKLQTELAGVNHVSVFGTGYAAKNGCHLVHFVGGPNDGAIVTHPLADKAHVIFLRFASQGF